MNNIIYIYGLSSSEYPDIIRYIGYSNNLDKRIKEHICDSKKLYTYKQKWIKSVLEKGFEIIITQLLKTTEDKKGEMEIETIKLFKSFGAKLVNGNNGGLGGKSPSIETRRKSSLSKIGNTWNKGRIPSNLHLLREFAKLPKTQEIKEKISKAKKGKSSKVRLLKEDVIVKIYELYNNGESLSSIIKILSLSKSTIANVLYSNFYKDVKNKYSLKLTRESYRNQFDKEIRPISYEQPPNDISKNE